MPNNPGAAAASSRPPTLWIALGVFSVGLAAGCTRGLDAPAGPAAATPPVAPPLTPEQLRERWGIEAIPPCLSAGGFMVDFRYKVLDPEKAAPLVDHAHKPLLIHQATGAKFIVPSAPKVGPLRQTTRERVPGRVYFVLFANPGRYVKAGDKVTVVIGDCRIADLIVR